MAGAAPLAVLAFDAGGERLAIDATAVREIIGRPRIARVPNAPPSLQGVASVRGLAVPILSVSMLRGSESASGSRVIILDQDPPVGLLVDNVASMQAAGAVAPLDIAALLRPALRTKTRTRIGRIETLAAQPAPAAAQTIGLLIFAIGKQDFALPLDQVKESITATEITPLPRSDAAVIGTAAYRDVLLPVVSLSALLAVNEADRVERRKIVVALIGRRPVGLVVDELRSVTRVPTDAIDPVPPMIARRSSEAKISAICRLDGGRRLVSILDTAQLMDGLESSQLPEIESMAVSDDRTAAEHTDPILVFQIGDQTFGLPAAVVEEVVQRPERLTKVPRSPDFVEGVMNLRGRAVPIIDQRARFGAPVTSESRSRVIIVALGDLLAGFVVDHVRDVLRIPRTAVTAAPEIADTTTVFDRVATLDNGEQIVLLIDPAQLLDETERRMLIALRKKASAKS